MAEQDEIDEKHDAHIPNVAPEEGFDNDGGDVGDINNEDFGTDL